MGRAPQSKEQCRLAVQSASTSVQHGIHLHIFEIDDLYRHMLPCRCVHAARQRESNHLHPVDRENSQRHSRTTSSMSSNV